MPVKVFKQRYVDRATDTVSGFNEAGSRSFALRGSFSTGTQSGTWLNFTAAGRAPANSAVPGKAPTRTDSILHTEFKIPTYSRILGAYIDLTHSIAPSTNHSFTGLEIGIFPDLQAYDADAWRGKKAGGNAEYAWRKNQQSNNERVTQIDNNAGNFWVKIREGATIKAQTNVAAAGVATQGALSIGRNVTDKYTGLETEHLRAAGNVVQIEASSSAIDNMLIRTRRQGTYTASVYILAKVYDYDVTNRKIGALRATSDPVDASALTTSTTTETTYTFTSTFAVTANEYVFVSIEPETTWGTLASRGNGSVVFPFMASLNNSDTGANAAGSEEVMWQMPTVGGNQAHYMQIDQLPALYSGATGRVIECYPYQRVVGICPFQTRPTAANEVSRLNFTPNLIRALENYNRDKDIDQDVQGVMWFLATGNSGQGTLTWSNATTATTRLTVVYRSTRTFIT